MKNMDLLKAEHRAYLEQRYLYGIPPRDLVNELASKFDVYLTAAQIRQTLSRRGLAAKRVLIDKETVELVRNTSVSVIAKSKACSPAAQLEAWSEDLIFIADKAVLLAKESGNPRELSSAAAALNNAIRLFRTCTGVESVSNADLNPYDYNFANRPMQRTKMVSIIEPTPKSRYPLITN